MKKLLVILLLTISFTGVAQTRKTPGTKSKETKTQPMNRVDSFYNPSTHNIIVEDAINKVMVKMRKKGYIVNKK